MQKRIRLLDLTAKVENRHLRCKSWSSWKKENNDLHSISTFQEKRKPTTPLVTTHGNIIERRSERWRIYLGKKKFITYLDSTGLKLAHQWVKETDSALTNREPSIVQ